MKCNYSQIDPVIYNKQQWYSIHEHVVYPDIISVIGLTLPEKKKIDDWRNMLGPIATNKKPKHPVDNTQKIYSMLEKQLAGEEVILKGFSPEDIRIYNSSKLGLKSITEIYGRDVFVWSDVLQVAGQCSLIGKWKGEEAIIDFKPDNKSEKDIQYHWLKYTFYALAHNELFGTDIKKGVIIKGTANGIPLVYEKDLIQFVEPLMAQIDKFYLSL